ncbi:MAG: hypothetical protein KDD42_07275, partial [Bdellovibrionales bacterium]|nr:hypothetical protein [Bdellovibrionales bacterium]
MVNRKAFRIVKMSPQNFIISLALIIGGILLSNSELLADAGIDFEVAPGYEVKQISSGEVDPYSVDTDNGQVVWTQNEQLFFFDGETTRQLTTAPSSVYYPKISDGMIVWAGREDDTAGWEIYLYDGDNTSQLTNNSLTDFIPDIDQGQIAWRQDVGSGLSRILFFDGENVVNLSDGSYQDWDPKISKGTVAWQRNIPGIGFQLVLYDGENTITVYEGEDKPEQDWDLHDGMLVWEEYDGNDTEIYLFNGTQNVQLTDNALDEATPKIHDGNIAWSSYNFLTSTSNISFFNGNLIIPLSNNDYQNENPFTYGGQAVWSTYNWDEGHNTIYLYDGSSSINLVRSLNSLFLRGFHSSHAVFTAGFPASLYLISPTQISGYVKWQNGSPIKDAVIEAYYLQGSEESPVVTPITLIGSETLSAADGSFALPPEFDAPAQPSEFDVTKRGLRAKLTYVEEDGETTEQTIINYPNWNPL